MIATWLSGSGVIGRGLLAALAVLLLLASAAMAESPSTAGGLGASDIETLTETARSKGVRIIVLEPEAPPPATEDDYSVVEGVETIETSFRALLAGAKRDLGAIEERLSRHWPEAYFLSLASAFALAIACAAAGFLVERWIMRRVAGRPPVATHLSAIERHRLRLRTAAVSAAGIVLGLTISSAIFLSLTARGGPEREVGYAVILVGALYMRLGFAVFEIALFGGRGSDAVERCVREGHALAVWLGLSVALVFVLDRLELGQDLVGLARMVLAALFLALLATVLWRNRATLRTEAMRNGSSLVIAAAPGLMAVYLVSALGLFVLDILIGIGITRGGVLAPIYFGVAALVFHSAIVVLLDLRARRIAALERARSAAPEVVTDSGAGTAATDATSEADAVTEAEMEADTPPPVAKRRQSELIARESALALWIGGIAWSWGVPLIAARGGVHPFWTIFLVIFLARLGWVLIDGFFARRLAEEQGMQGPAEPGDEGGSAGSRLGTLLPLMRTFLLITVIVISTMIVLSKLGVDIAPLFAGAGLVGLAVGFGAQSLVRDIFSGLFFLIDDAFRQGEYIETGGLRGTVEKISIRSMQLRHHTGPLHTIPFGEIVNLTNFSRDWVIMKLPLRVTFDTDPERVRKLVKKLGQELLQDPVIGDKFIEPLKSQGVREIDDSGQIIRVKFMTRPGEQFVLRKQVYARIRELFEREGIEFARKEVRVRVSGGDHLSDQELEQIAGAAAEGATETPPAKA